ncbi:tyrosine-type recombinase/integrase [Halobacillus sp. Marseille-P3879]|uniref:tyrosine-type recombinase/integrase n=1 Tax=Halobacillus sp. Marseille-P3879 TaxID=2045014 RepID=UPI000C7BB010|nr:tyrosine-type recombinase/integrase [Halobacillus sp. Marseille-P3879]
MDNFEFQLDNFLLYCDSKNLSRKTLASYEQSLRLFQIYLQQEHDISSVEKVSSAHIRQYIKNLRERGKYSVVSNESSMTKNYPDRRSDLGKTISDTTISNYLRNIKVFFNFLYNEKEIMRNPVDNIPAIKPSRKQKKLLTPDELRRFFKHFDVTTFHNYRAWLQCRLILDTGIRAGESCELLPEDIDFQYNSILIRNPKNNKERYVYFSRKMNVELKRWMKYRDRYSDSPYVFPTTRGTKQDVRNFERALKKVGDKAGVSVHPHQLRNNFAKYYLLNGGDWSTLSRILGHSSAEVTQKAYVDFTEEEIGKKYQKHSPMNFLDI